MIDNSNCCVKDNCNHRDCNSFCVRNYKLSYLYDSALVSQKQRMRVVLRLDSDESDRESFEYLAKISKNILKFVSSGGNLYLHSSITGNGKTAWSLRLMQSYFNSIWSTSELKCRGLFISVPRYLIELKDNISQKSDYIQHIKDNVLTADLVIWDEVGTKGLTQFEHENILSLINSRIDNGKANIYTSNLNTEELKSVVGDRLYSRIVLMSDDVELKGSDKRIL